MAKRYHVGNTPHNRQVVRDDQRGTVVCIAMTTDRAEDIAHALNLVDAVPQRLQLQDDGTYRDSGSLPPLPNPLPPAECVDVAARGYLSDLFSFLCAAGTDEWHADAVPSPPWVP